MLCSHARISEMPGAIQWVFMLLQGYTWKHLTATNTSTAHVSNWNQRRWGVGLDGGSFAVCFPIPMVLSLLQCFQSRELLEKPCSRMSWHGCQEMEGGECRARLPALPAHLVWPLNGKGGAANCRWKHRGPRLGTFFRDSAQSHRTGTSPECGAHR